ncbi:MAG: phage virion morphogenesis protein [Thermodesulfobacteriota bacterium]
MTQLTYEWTGVNEVVEALGKFGKGLTDLRGFLGPAATVIIESSQKNFEAGGRPKWPPLSPVTVLLRGKKLRGYREHKRGANKGRTTAASFNKYISGIKTLRDTGELMASIGSTGAGGIYNLSEKTVDVGTSLNYAALLQYGGTGSGFIKKQIPARPFLKVMPEDEVKILAFGDEFLAKLIKESGA